MGNHRLSVSLSTKTKVDSEAILPYVQPLGANLITVSPIARLYTTALLASGQNVTATLAFVSPG